MFKGIAYSVLASVTFGVLYFYTQLLGALDSEQTFGWRRNGIHLPSRPWPQSWRLAS